MVAGNTLVSVDFLYHKRGAKPTVLFTLDASVIATTKFKLDDTQFWFGTGVKVNEGATASALPSIYSCAPISGEEPERGVAKWSSVTDPIGTPPFDVSEL